MVSPKSSWDYSVQSRFRLGPFSFVRCVQTKLFQPSSWYLVLNKQPHCTVRSFSSEGSMNVAISVEFPRVRNYCTDHRANRSSTVCFVRLEMTIGQREDKQFRNNVLDDVLGSSCEELEAIRHRP